MKFNGQAKVCVCGKLCTSRPGLTLHQRVCKEAQVAIKSGKNSIASSNIIEPEIPYVSDVQELIDLTKDLAIDAHQAIADGNKSAGRRARVSLLKLRDMILPLRKLILKKTQ